jgi:hypothetical protein
MKYSFSFRLIFFTLWLLTASCEDNDRNDLAGCVNTANPDTLTFAAQLKGWEVYSWPGCQDLNFSVLYGTNALKNYAEVTGTQGSSRFVIKVWGKTNMKTILSRMPAGESVSLIGENWLSRTWGAGAVQDLHLPPVSVITELQQVATQAGLNFQVVN